MQDESGWGGVGDLNCLECDGVRALVVIVKCVSQCLPLCFWGSVRDVTALLHERTEREPERVQDAELVDRGLGDRVRLFACK